MDLQNRFRINILNTKLKGAATSKNLFFIDDMNAAAVDVDAGNAQPTLEVLRQMISEGKLIQLQSNI